MINIAKDKSTAPIAGGTGGYGTAVKGEVDFKDLLIGLYNRPGEILNSMAAGGIVTLLGRQFDSRTQTAEMMLAGQLEINNVQTSLSTILGIKGTFYSSVFQKLNGLLGSQ